MRRLPVVILYILLWGMSADVYSERPVRFRYEQSIRRSPRDTWAIANIHYRPIKITHEDRYRLAAGLRDMVASEESRLVGMSHNDDGTFTATIMQPQLRVAQALMPTTLGAAPGDHVIADEDHRPITHYFDTKNTKIEYPLGQESTIQNPEVEYFLHSGEEPVDSQAIENALGSTLFAARPFVDGRTVLSTVYNNELMDDPVSWRRRLVSLGFEPLVAGTSRSDRKFLPYTLGAIKIDEASAMTEQSFGDVNMGFWPTVIRNAPTPKRANLMFTQAHPNSITSPTAPSVGYDPAILWVIAGDLGYDTHISLHGDEYTQKHIEAGHAGDIIPDSFGRQFFIGPHSNSLSTTQLFDNMLEFARRMGASIWHMEFGDAVDVPFKLDLRSPDGSSVNIENGGSFVVSFEYGQSLLQREHLIRLSEQLDLRLYEIPGLALWPNMTIRPEKHGSLELRHGVAFETWREGFARSDQSITSATIPPTYPDLYNKLRKAVADTPPIIGPNIVPSRISIRDGIQILSSLNLHYVDEDYPHPLLLLGKKRSPVLAAAEMFTNGFEGADFLQLANLGERCASCFPEFTEVFSRLSADTDVPPEAVEHAFSLLTDIYIAYLSADDDGRPFSPKNTANVGRPVFENALSGLNRLRLAMLLGGRHVSFPSSSNGALVQLTGGLGEDVNLIISADDRSNAESDIDWLAQRAATIVPALRQKDGNFGQVVQHLISNNSSLKDIERELSVAHKAIELLWRQLDGSVGNDSVAFDMAAKALADIDQRFGSIAYRGEDLKERLPGFSELDSSVSDLKFSDSKIDYIQFIKKTDRRLEMEQDLLRRADVIADLVRLLIAVSVPEKREDGIKYRTQVIKDAVDNELIPRQNDLITFALLLSGYQAPMATNDEAEGAE